jgi:hypothetical protein
MKKKYTQPRLYLVGRRAQNACMDGTGPLAKGDGCHNGPAVTMDGPSVAEDCDPQGTAATFECTQGTLAVQSCPGTGVSPGSYCQNGPDD